MTFMSTAFPARDLAADTVAQVNRVKRLRIGYAASDFKLVAELRKRLTSRSLPRRHVGAVGDIEVSP